MSSLFDAPRLRVARGREHLAELDDLSSEVCDEYAEQLDAHYPRVLANGVDLLALFDSKHPEPNIPPRIAVLTGEIVYNFRAALDYAVCALAGGRHRNQFPIESSAHGFSSRRQTFLEGLDDASVRRIETYQPYMGCNWTRQLARLSNLDKHNRLIVVAQGVTIKITDPEIEGKPIQCVISLHLRAENEETPLTELLTTLGDRVTEVLNQLQL